MKKAEYLAKRETMYNEAKELVNAGKVEDANAKMDEIKNLDEELKKTAKAEADLNALGSTPAIVNLSGATVIPSATPSAPAEPEDLYNSKEYRIAFKNYVMNHTPIPDKFKNVAGITKTTDVGSVISPTVLGRIIEKMESTGMILPLVTKNIIRFGRYGTHIFCQTGGYMGGGGGTSDKQKKTTGQIDIKGFKLRCAIAMTLETSVMSLEMFETQFVNNVAEAMVKAQEIAMISGTGTGQPKGVLTETAVTGQSIEIAAAADPAYQTLVDAEAALPWRMKNGAVWNMTKKTFMKFIGMVDTNKQPIARVNYGINGQPERSLLGRRVVLNDYMTSLGTTIEDDTVVAFLFDWSDYMFNTNYNMTVKSYEDNDTEDQITKAVMICDGKVIDKNSLVTVTKKAA